MPYLYILECADGSYYTGSTTDLERRLWEHQNGQGAKHTAKRLPVKLVYCDECDRIDDVFFREKQIQGWSRKKKQALIAGDSNQLHRLAVCRNETHCRNVLAGFGDGGRRGQSAVPFDSAQGTAFDGVYPRMGAQGAELKGTESKRTGGIFRSQDCTLRLHSGNNPKPLLPLAIIALTAGGKKLAARLADQLQAEVVDPQPQGLALTLAAAWPAYQGFILIMAAGIAVRTIAPLLNDKRSDPGVVVMDEAGRFAVSLLAGHLGGANALARQVAAITGGQAVITTASDSLGLTAIDLWARYHGLVLVQGSLTAASATLVNTGRIKVFIDLPGTLPPDFVVVADPDQAELIISNRLPPAGSSQTILCPKNLAMGIGCNRGTTAEQIEKAARATCRQHGFLFQAVGRLASIDLKQDEYGLLQFAAAHGLDLQWYHADLLNTVPGVTSSAAVMKATGAKAVAEPAALLVAQTDTLLIRKTKWKDVTIALAQIATRLTGEYQ